MRRRTGSCLLVLLTAIVALTGCGGGSKPDTKPAEETTTYKLRMAQSMWNGGRISESLALIDEAIEIEPDNPGFYNIRGGYAFRSGRPTLAEASFRKALELDPYFTDARHGLGAVLDLMGRKDEAEQELRRALADTAYPTPEKVYLTLGRLYDSQGRVQEALEMLRRAVAINPKYDRGHFELASVLERLGKLEEAVREYEVAGRSYTSSGEYYYRLGFTYYRLGKLTKARENLIRVRTVSPGSPSAAKADELLETIE